MLTLYNKNELLLKIKMEKYFSYLFIERILQFIIQIRGKIFIIMR